MSLKNRQKFNKLHTSLLNILIYPLCLASLGHLDDKKQILNTGVLNILKYLTTHLEELEEILKAKIQ